MALTDRPFILTCGGGCGEEILLSHYAEGNIVY